MQFDRLRNSVLTRPAVLLALAAVAPLAVFAAFNADLALDRRQTFLIGRSIEGVQSIGENIDRQISTAMEDAQILAEAPALDQAPEGAPSRLGVFEEVARRTRARHHDWLTIVLRAPDGRWIFSTAAHDDAADREVQDRQSFDQAVRTGRPVVGDVVKGAHGEWGIPLRAPVVRQGRVVYVVTVVVNPSAVRETLSSLRMTGDWVTFVANAQGHVVARLPDDGGRSMGASVSAEGQAARAKGGRGTYAGHMLDGSANQSFYWVSPTSHWSAHAALPRTVWLAPLRQLMVTMLVGFLACLALSGLLVFLWWRDSESRRRQSAAVELATRIDALGRLTGGVAHDFNNLLTVIAGNTEILGRRVKGLAQAQRPLEAIRAASERATQLTRQLLVFARGGPAEPERVDLGRKVLDQLGALSQLVGSQIAIDTDIEPRLPAVRVDPLQLEAALLNLAANARDAMAGAGALYIKLRRAGDMVALSVRDEGPGFDLAALPRVFDPFFTTKPVGQGTGLGLSQVYGLVKGAGGRVEAANAPGGGAVVTLYLPVAKGGAAADPAAADPAPSPAVASEAQSPGPDRLPILLVDDNEAVRSTTATFLRECGLTVIEAPDAAAALAVLEVHAVEAVVSDIVMPGELDGMGLAQAVQASWPDLPVLLVSGFSERAADAQARGLAVINKPYSLPDLERRLRQLERPSKPSGRAARAARQSQDG